jgi:hypothetical protein
MEEEGENMMMMETMMKSGCAALNYYADDVVDNYGRVAVIFRCVCCRLGWNCILTHHHRAFPKNLMSLMAFDESFLARRK